MPTRKEIMKARTRNGGWTRAQLSVWGVPWPPPAGWVDTLVGVSCGRIPRPRDWASPLNGSVKVTKKTPRKLERLPDPPREWRPGGSIF